MSFFFFSHSEGQIKKKRTTKIKKRKETNDVSDSAFGWDRRINGRNSLFKIPDTNGWCIDRGDEVLVARIPVDDEPNTTRGTVLGRRDAVVAQP